MRSRLGRTVVLIVGLVGWVTVRSQAQGPAVQSVSPFDIVGFIDAATLTTSTDVFSGGTITVNGTVITVPAHTLLQMPAFALTWQEVFTQAPAPWGPTQSGLARADRDAAGNAPLTTYEVHIQGNRVVGGGRDQYIAGLMFIAQQSLNAAAGFINFIDYGTGEMYVGGAITSPPTPNSGARVVINDPAGKFGRPMSNDPRFTIDEDNPTVRSETGYPMCVPRSLPTDPTIDPATGAQAFIYVDSVSGIQVRPTIDPNTGNPTFDPTAGAATVTYSDPNTGAVRTAKKRLLFGDALCPPANRPKGADGNYLTVFTADYTALWAEWGLVPGDFVGNGTNPLLMAPFEIGDYVSYAGALASDANGGQYVSAHQVIANVGLFTQPASQPVYTAIDVMLLGVGGIPDPNLPQEAAVRTRIEGFTTDPSSFIDLFALDIDPCTGLESQRYYATVSVDPGPPPPGVAAPGKGAAGAVAGRWRWRPSADAPFLPPTRMLRAINEDGTYMDWDTGVTVTPNGLKDVGLYSAPNFEFIFPENLGIGTAPVPNNFQDFPFLANGSGPYFGATPGPASGRLAQLSPWPGGVAPVAPLCPAGGGTAVYSPVADAGPSQTAKSGDSVTINGAGSRDTTVPTALPLTYKWTQVGPRVPSPTKPGETILDPKKTVVLPTGFGLTSSTPDRTFKVDKYTNTRKVAAGDVLTFQLDVSNGTATSSATMAITITQNPVAVDTLTALTATFRVRRSRLDVTVTTSNPAAVLTVLGFGDMGPALAIAPGVAAPAGDRRYSQVGVNPIPTTITVRSNLGGTATVPVTIRP